MARAARYLLLLIQGLVTCIAFMALQTPAMRALSPMWNSINY